jgi:hypothetical protein
MATFEEKIMAKFETTVIVNDQEHEAEVEFYHQPEEQQTLEHPGCDESAHIERVIIWIGALKVDLLDPMYAWILNADDLALLETEALESVTDQECY